MKIGIRWDESGIQMENALDLYAFMLNKEGKCKNNRSIIGPIANYTSSECGSVIYTSNNSIGQRVYDENKACETLTVKTDAIPIWCKEIVVVACFFDNTQNVRKFNDLELFEISVDEKTTFRQAITSPSSASTMIVGNIVLAPTKEWMFVEKYMYMDKNIYSIAGEFNIKLTKE